MIGGIGRDVQKVKIKLEELRRDVSHFQSPREKFPCRHRHFVAKFFSFSEPEVQSPMPVGGSADLFRKVQIAPQVQWGHPSEAVPRLLSTWNVPLYSPGGEEGR